jgi:hypothetical protein
MTPRIPRFEGPHASYFSNLGIPKTAKIGIDSLVGPTTTKPWSHKGAWPRIIRSSLKLAGYSAEILTDADKWDSFDVIVMDHGMEYNGVFNLYGGANDELADRVLQFHNFKGRIVSYEIPMPDIGKFVIDRSKSCTPKFAEIVSLAGELTNRSAGIPYADAIDPTGLLVVGDSHSLSAWRVGAEIRRYDGRTLHGAIKRGLDTMLYNDGAWEHVTFYFGNIDIRHHLYRQPNPKDAAKLLVEGYVNQLEKNLDRFKSFSIVHLIPVEDESRSIPKTGYYEGEPFKGSRAERQDLVDYINSSLTELVGPENTLPWNHLIRDFNGALSFASMERPKSVHISPMFYQFHIETGIKWSPELIAAKPEILEKPVMNEPSEPVTPKAPRVPKVKSSGVLTKNLVYQDLLEYHTKAHLLEKRARMEEAELPDDPLMCNVHIYDSVHRYCAGFSNLLEDLHFPNRQKKLRNERVDRLPLRETLYLYLVHRVCGSAASFRPTPETAKTLEQKMEAGAHGYYNTILPKLWKHNDVKSMTEAVLIHDGPYLTSKGNIPPQFKAVFGGYDKPSREFLCHHAPQLIDDVLDYTREKRKIRDLVDFMNGWNQKRGMIRFSFCYTAFANDVGEYWPNLVDPFSHTYYGPNCMRSLALAFEGSARPRETAYDKVMEWLVEDTGFKPFDLEDSPCCDIQRYWSEEVPQGYNHLSREQTRNNSLLKREWGADKYYAWVGENVHLRSSGVTVDTRDAELSVASAKSNSDQVAVVAPSAD